MTKEEAIQLASSFLLANPDVANEVDATQNNAKLMPANLAEYLGAANAPWAVAFPYVTVNGAKDNPDSLVLIVNVDTKQVTIMPCL